MTVVYDEIDNGVHDLLLTRMILALKDGFSGQLIITTHNTMLLEELSPHDVYIINTDYEGNKRVVCADQFDIQSNHNMRMRYLKGLFGGTPFVDEIDYDEIDQILKSKGE